MDLYHEICLFAHPDAPPDHRGGDRAARHDRPHADDHRGDRVSGRRPAPRDGLREAPAGLHRFYASVEPTLSNVRRDAGTVPPVRRALGPYATHLARITEVITTAYAPRRPPARAAIRHATAFRT
jgi:hypothetical protein